MSDLDAGAAPAAAASTPAPAANASTDAPVDTTNPISTHIEAAPKAEPKPTEPVKPVTAREALEKAAAKVREGTKAEDQKSAASDTTPKEPAKPADAKAPVASKAEAPAVDPQKSSSPATGDQVAPVQSSKYTAPERFSPDAKTAWESAPEPVKAEVHRAIRELEQGHQKYKADAEAFNEVREYHDLAKQHGTSVKDALSRYTGLERRLTSADPQTKSTAVVEVLRYAGISPQQFAAQILGVPVDQARSQTDDTVYALRQELATLKQQLGGVTTSIQEQHNTALLTDISKFAETHPRFDELGESIAKLISTGMADDLDAAYEMAERLNPAAAVAPQPAPPAPTQDDLKAQTLKGSKSVAGAPSAGSDPDRKGKPSSSIRQALERAAAQRV